MNYKNKKTHEDSVLLLKLSLKFKPQRLRVPTLQNYIVI